MEEVALKNQLAKKINNLTFSFYLTTFGRLAGRLKVVHVMMLLILAKWKWRTCSGFARLFQNIGLIFLINFFKTNYK